MASDSGGRVPTVERTDDAEAVTPSGADEVEAGRTLRGNRWVLLWDLDRDPTHQAIPVGTAIEYPHGVAVSLPASYAIPALTDDPQQRSATSMGELPSPAQIGDEDYFDLVLMGLSRTFAITRLPSPPGPEAETGSALSVWRCPTCRKYGAHTAISGVRALSCFDEHEAVDFDYLGVFVPVAVGSPPGPVTEVVKENITNDIPPALGRVRVTDEAMEAALEGYRQASHGCNAIPEWLRGALEAALPHGFVGTDPVSVQPNPAQTSEVEAVAREMGEAIAKGRLHGYATPVGFPALIAWADRLEAALLHLKEGES